MTAGAEVKLRVGMRTRVCAENKEKKRISIAAGGSV